jgi:hypothetical protein
MSDQLKGLFGGGQDKDEAKTKARDFINRYSTGDPAEGYSREEAADRFREVLQRASPEQIQRATRRAVENMPENERAAFGQMLEQRKAGQGMVDIERTGGTGGATAANDPLGGLLGGLLGGGTAGGAAGSLDDLFGSMSGGQGGGLGGMLGGLFGGGDETKPQTGAADSGGGDPLGAIGDLMSSPAGKALIGGIAAFAMKEMIDND